MNEPYLHYATDRRCYNGAMHSDLEREASTRQDLFSEIRGQHPDYFCTYFPAEGKYMSFIKYKELTGNFFEDKGQCLLEAWRTLVRDKN